MSLPWDEPEHEHSWLNLRDNLWETLRAGVTRLWEEVRAIDTVVESVAVEFGGEDPLRPDMRGVLETTREKLNLHRLLAVEESLELPEPVEEAMELVQTYFENGKRLMERI